MFVSLTLTLPISYALGLQVDKWRHRHEAIASGGEIEMESMSGMSGGSSAGSRRAATDRDRQNMIAITDALDEAARKAAHDAETALRKVRLPS